MKISAVPLKIRKGKTRARVLQYLEEHSDEVFRIRQCGEVAQALGAPQRTVEHALWALQHDGLISKARLEEEIWYGSHAAVDKLISLRPDAVHI